MNKTVPMKRLRPCRRFCDRREGQPPKPFRFPWAQKYPTLLDGIASDTLTDYAFYTIASENLKARGESLTCDYFGDQQVTISVAGAEKGEAAAQIPQDKLQEG